MKQAIDQLAVAGLVALEPTVQQQQQQRDQLNHVLSKKIQAGQTTLFLWH